jgi:hypothetical protein
MFHNNNDTAIRKPDVSVSFLGIKILKRSNALCAKILTITSVLNHSASLNKFLNFAVKDMIINSPITNKQNHHPLPPARAPEGITLGRNASSAGIPQT